MVEVLVEYDYLAKESDELSLKKGDVIREVVKKPGGWWEGVLNDKKGLFPDNFVRLIDKDSSVVYRNKKDSQRIRQCRVVFSYKQDNPDELNLNVGDVINILGEEEEGWWRGVLNGKQGVFPSNFVEEIKSKPGSREDLTDIQDVKSPTLPPKPTKTLCQVKYSYKAQNEDELTLKEGDIISLISKDGQDPGWWKGELSGEVGVFPDNFVAIISAEDKAIKEDHKTVKATALPDSGIPKTVPVVSAHRKSLDEKQEKEKVENHITKSSPPIPSKKPQVPIKKSPSGSSSHGGILAGLKKKIVDVVDGASSSKGQQPILIKSSEIKDDKIEAIVLENAFDQVERTPVLQDVRATRAKAPGRRPPSVIFKEGELGIPNGNTDHIQVENFSELLLSNSRSPTSVNNEAPEEVKPKVREWEKHKAPWLEEMKLSQAKRTSTSPGPPEQTKLKFSSTDKLPSPDVEDVKSTSKVSPFEQQPSSPIDMTKSMSSIEKSSSSSAVLRNNKTPPNEIEKSSINLRNKQPSPQNSVRLQNSHSVSITTTSTSEPVAPKQLTTNQEINQSTPFLKTSPVSAVHSNNKGLKTAIAEKNNNSHDIKVDQDVSVSSDHYKELLQRIEKLEATLLLQEQAHKAVIEDLQNKLQVEIDKRMLLQVEVDKISQCVMQV